ncbi:hypothetical protein [Pacificitalea manganoxidans]|nr:hypothetical protein [Pacificitalea manganoxidans]
MTAESTGSARRLTALKDENTKLKKLLTEQMLGLVTLDDLVSER